MNPLTLKFQDSSLATLESDENGSVNIYQRTSAHLYIFIIMLMVKIIIQLTITEGLLCAKHVANYHTCIILFNQRKITGA